MGYSCLALCFLLSFFPFLRGFSFFVWTPPGRSSCWHPTRSGPEPSPILPEVGPSRVIFSPRRGPCARVRRRKKTSERGGQKKLKRGGLRDRERERDRETCLGDARQPRAARSASEVPAEAHQAHPLRSPAPSCLPSRHPAGRAARAGGQQAGRSTQGGGAPRPSSQFSLKRSFVPSARARAARFRALAC